MAKRRPKAAKGAHDGERKTETRQVLLTPGANHLLINKAEDLGISVGEAIERLIRTANWELVRNYGKKE